MIKLKKKLFKAHLSWFSFLISKKLLKILWIYFILKCLPLIVISSLKIPKFTVICISNLFPNTFIHRNKITEYFSHHQNSRKKTRKKFQCHLLINFCLSQTIFSSNSLSWRIISFSLFNRLVKKVHFSFVPNKQFFFKGDFFF